MVWYDQERSLVFILKVVRYREKVSTYKPLHVCAQTDEALRGKGKPGIGP